MKLDEIKPKLISSDARMAANMLGMSRTYVQNIIDGSRRCESERAKKIVEVLGKLVHQREELAKSVEKVEPRIKRKADKSTQLV